MPILFSLKRTANNWNMIMAIAHDIIIQIFTAYHTSIDLDRCLESQFATFQGYSIIAGRKNGRPEKT